MNKRKSGQPPLRNRQNKDASNSNVQCFYCDAQPLLKNLGDHIKTKHEGKPLRHETLGKKTNEKTMDFFFVSSS